MNNELEEKIKKAKEDSWTEGYFAGRDDDPSDCPSSVSWPSQWRIGYSAAVEDKERKVQNGKRQTD